MQKSEELSWFPAQFYDFVSGIVAWYSKHFTTAFFQPSQTPMKSDQLLVL
jgi:hypothetical protein